MRDGTEFEGRGWRSSGWVEHSSDQIVGHGAIERTIVRSRHRGYRNQ